MTKNDYCAVLIQIDFMLNHHQLSECISTSTIICLTVTGAISEFGVVPIEMIVEETMSNGAVPFYFPKKGERISYRGGSFEKTRETNPDVSIAAGLAPLSSNVYERKDERTGFQNVWLHRMVTQSPRNSHEAPIQIRWSVNSHLRHAWSGCLTYEYNHKGHFQWMPKTLSPILRNILCLSLYRLPIRRTPSVYLQPYNH